MHTQELHENNSPSWLGSINAILEHFPNINSIKIKSVSANTFKKQVHTALRSLYLTHWVENRQDNLNSKLRTYTKFKCFFQRENYLSIIKNYDCRRSFSRFRISCHKLIIETGRYRNIPVDLRICSHCNSGAVGDEMHFLLFCDKFHCERQAMLEVINEECANFSRLLDWDKFIWLMNNENPRILSSVSKFINLYCD